MGALFTCCRRTKSPTTSQTNIRAMNEEINVRNGDVVVESRSQGNEEKYAYSESQVEGSLQLDEVKSAPQDEDEEGVVEEVMEATTRQGVESAPPPRPEPEAEDAPPTTNRREVTSTVSASKDGEGNATVKKTTIVRETTETRTVSQRSSIPMLKPTPEGKPKPKVVIVREY